ncbi:MAG: hypothetical protein U1C57_03215 [Candidatus Doudnabacteria bacterium]|nr:hypothetical protein [Candidatus Doudnabacteria bacterium]
MSIERDLEFLYQVGTLRNMARGWQQHFGGLVPSSVAEHSFRIVWLDIAESKTSDHSYVPKMYVKIDESRATAETFEKTSIEDCVQVIEEFDRRDSIEAKIVKDADNLDIDLEMKEIEETGNQLVRKWADTRRIVRDEKLYTESAKKIWDAIQTSDVSRWHLKNNKWYKMPEAGK